ncbi:hypothetical protein acsn021_02810 [Anaerocolumna cellulosilytica]|uniref:Uncharacterized protein n=1 Tax=Anaerocolumna cellulosilytica TaxID=433286 RepID=A0A6S6QZK7_9FIRM|nr:hypothetical protein [Anaerocolumna cellulosilytica]MBB5196886.1 hypothetical protein [Anaerocolumna cellulosilytica]BCJ92712.1 hypothetical protein acsn021_02810 [Anaerocolumna cellulosilytica]
MKNKLLALLTVMCLLFINYTTVIAQSIKAKDVNLIEANIKGCNITFKKGTSKSYKFSYYGTASDTIYDFKTSIEDDVLKIDLRYIGNDKAPSIKEGGIVVKVPDKAKLSLDITGSSSAGITLNNINLDTNLNTESCAVIITNDKAENKITIESKYDSYEIISASPKKEFNIKANGSAIDFKLNKAPKNLHFKLTEKNADVVIPKTWRYDYSIGSGKPDMVIDIVDSVFELYY